MSIKKMKARIEVTEWFGKNKREMMKRIIDSKHHHHKLLCISLFYFCSLYK